MLYICISKIYINKTDMKTKHYLLSYKWQTAGWILLAVALMLTCLIVGVGLYMTMSEAVTKLFVAAVYVVTAVSLIAFSEERQEDEFIKSLRGRSLAAAACVAFVLSIIWFCVSNVGRMYLPLQMGDDLWWKFSLVDNYLSIIPMFFLYIVIFKASLWVYRWRSRHEE